MTMKAAVIGCGRMGAFTSESVRRWAPDCWFPLAHAEAVAAHPGLELAALCDTDRSNLERARAAYGSPPGYDDFRLLAAEVRPDLATLATRTIGRAEIIMTMFDHGCRAFHVEKPLCNSVAELEQLAAILRRPDVFATYGAVRRFFHIYQAARDLVGTGKLGKLLEVRVNFGPGALFWAHPHAVDLILFAAEGRKVVGVQAHLDRLESGGSPDAVINDPQIRSATIWFDDGVAGHIGRAPGLDFVMSCERGHVTVRSDGRACSVAEHDGDDPYLVRRDLATPVRVEEPQGTLAPLTQLTGCLAGDAAAITANVAIKADILAGQRILFAMIQSHLCNSSIVTLDVVDPDLRILAKSGENYA